MASKKVSDLTVVATPSVDDLMMVVQGGTSKQQSLDRIPRSLGILAGFHYGSPHTQGLVAASGVVEVEALDGGGDRGNISYDAGPPLRLDFSGRDDYALLRWMWVGKFSVAAVLDFTLDNGTDIYGYLSQEVPADSWVTLTGSQLLFPSSIGGPYSSKEFGLRVKTDTDGTLTTKSATALVVGI